MNRRDAIKSAVGLPLIGVDLAKPGTEKTVLATMSDGGIVNASVLAKELNGAPFNLHCTWTYIPPEMITKVTETESDSKR